MLSKVWRRVFPAYAGMFLCLLSRHPIERRFPRIRGDVPSEETPECLASAFSPHTRGCSGSSKLIGRGYQVFPAYAGMFPMYTDQQLFALRFPRIRGDVPRLALHHSRGAVFSPHTRGCSSPPYACRGWWGVFPAYAGMFPRHPASSLAGYSFPRIRGDVPDSFLPSDSPLKFSPHTRGCSPPSHAA